jgi:hypothetical protein
VLTKLSASGIIVKCATDEACRGGDASYTENPCSSGYTGQRCGDCSAGHYWVGRRCKDCFPSKFALALLAVFVPFIIALAFYCWLLYAAVQKERSVVMVPLTDFLQVAGMLVTLRTDFHPVVQTVLDIAQLSNVDLGILQIDCLVPRNQEEFYLGIRKYLIIPLAIPPLHFVLYLVLRLLKKLKPEWTLKGLLVDEITMQNAVQNVMVRMFAFLHTPILVQWMNIFICNTLSDGNSELQASPGLNCFTERWEQAKVEAIVAFTLWCIACPLGIWIWMGRHVGQEDFMGKFSLVAYGYTEFAYWWEPFEMLRRVLLAVALVMAKVAYDQLAVVIILLVIYIVMSFLFAPFNDPYITVLHALTDATLLFIVVTGLVSPPRAGEGTIAGSAVAAAESLRTRDAATLAVVFVCFCVSVSVLLWSVVFVLECKNDLSMDSVAMRRIKTLVSRTRDSAQKKAEQSAQLVNNIKAKALMQAGQLVMHPTRGKGTVTEIDWNDPRQKPYVVSFDNGEVHHYSAASVMKLKKIDPPATAARALTRSISKKASSFKLSSPVEKMGGELSSQRSERKNAIRSQSEFTALGQRSGSPPTSAPRTPKSPSDVSTTIESEQEAAALAASVSPLHASNSTTRRRQLTVFHEEDHEEDPNEDQIGTTDRSRHLSLASSASRRTSDTSDPASAYLGGNGFLAAHAAQQSDISFVDAIATDARSGEPNAFSCEECGHELDLAARSAAVMMCLADRSAVPTNIGAPTLPANGDGPGTPFAVAQPPVQLPRDDESAAPRYLRCCPCPSKCQAVTHPLQFLSAALRMAI